MKIYIESNCAPSSRTLQTSDMIGKTILFEKIKKNIGLYYHAPVMVQFLHHIWSDLGRIQISAKLYIINFIRIQYSTFHHQDV